MWWFVLTFVIGLTAGRLRCMPAVFLRRPQWLVYPTLICLVFLLGYGIGGNDAFLSHWPTVMVQSVLIAALSMLGAAVFAAVTTRWFHPRTISDTKVEMDEENS